jgi:hypothetical protein
MLGMVESYGKSNKKKKSGSIEGEVWKGNWKSALLGLKSLGNKERKRVELYGTGEKKKRKDIKKCFLKL